MITGFRRADGRLGARNLILSLPSVVCATQVAGQLAGPGVVCLVHQHGCLHVGDDVGHTEQAFTGVAVSPNVGGVVVVSLGCETIQGRRLASRITELGQQVAFVGIQIEGGTQAAARSGLAQITRLRGELERCTREVGEEDELLIGIDARDSSLRTEIARAAEARGLRWTVSETLFGAPAHVELAGRGAQVLVAVRGAGEAPLGFAVCPVLSVTTDESLFAALHDDFDYGAFGCPGDDAERIIDRAVAAFCGEMTAAERRGSADFVLHRLAVTM